MYLMLTHKAKIPRYYCLVTRLATGFFSRGIKTKLWAFFNRSERCDKLLLSVKSREEGFLSVAGKGNKKWPPKSFEVFSIRTLSDC